MEAVLSDVVAPEDLLKFEKKYNSELAKGAVSKETKFEYAWCLIRSKYSQDIKKGIVLLEELVQKASKDDSRDFLFYLAVANYRLKVSGTCFFSVQVYGRQNEETDLQKSLLLYHAAFELQIRERAKVKSDRQRKIFLSLTLPLTSCSSLKACHLTHWFAFTEGFSNWSNPKVLLRHGYIH
uniref:Mitochondrial fission 1 protein n=1 Tax=Astatotilapia calliptera TaxID=8154 RepID=A0AAX7SWV2_ASTCA